MSTLRSLYRDTRALSPVVATILLVAIAVIASVLTYLWATGFIGAIQTRPSQATETIHSQVGSYTVSSRNFTLYLTNAGTQSVSITDLFILNTAGSVLAHSAVGPTTIGVGATVSVSVIMPPPSTAIASGNQIILQAVSAKGTDAEITVTASA